MIHTAYVTHEGIEDIEVLVTDDGDVVSASIGPFEIDLTDEQYRAIQTLAVAYLVERKQEDINDWRAA